MRCPPWQYVAPSLRGKLELNTEIAYLLLSWQLQKTKSVPCRVGDVAINLVLQHISLLPSLNTKNVVSGDMMLLWTPAFEILGS